MSGDRLVGRVKWFNNKSGYGFISTCDDETKDIFAHYSALRSSEEDNAQNGFHYRYLVQGEYVEFVMEKTEDEKHEIKAGDISGIKGGPLMCDTKGRNINNGDRRKTVSR
jgi:cold shock CspA family protein